MRGQGRSLGDLFGLQAGDNRWPFHGLKKLALGFNVSFRGSFDPLGSWRRLGPELSDWWFVFPHQFGHRVERNENRLAF